VRRNRNISGHEGERGVVILLVAIFLLFVVGAMAVLAIDFVTFYTARSEAQLAADGGALAGARVLANSGMTSKPGDALLLSNAENLARTVATQVAVQNKVGGRFLNASEVIPSVSGSSFLTGSDPRVTVQVTRNDLPTFFARIWGRTQVTVSASATAEAYNPSALTSSAANGPPVAPVCVKPWLLPNMDPTGTNPNAPIFAPTGAIADTTMLGKSWPNLNPGGNPQGLTASCPSGDCSGVGALGTPSPGKYYPGSIDSTDFPVPTQSLPSCSAGLNDYQLAVVGCVERPIACGATPTISIDTNPYSFHTTDRDGDTVEAGKCLIHDKGAAGDSDSIDPTWSSGEPFQFLAGNANPVANAVGKEVLVSDSLVTVPVFNSSPGMTPPTAVTVIGFLQVFLNHQGVVLPPPAPGAQIPATIINMAGCGAAATGQPIMGNSSSPVAVRLVR
jgi:hypothetical protein